MERVEGAGRMEVTLTPLGNKIKMTVTGRVVCERQGEMRKSFTYDVTDGAWLGSGVFKTRAEKRRFMRRGRTIRKVIGITPWFDNCDRIV
jgi:hypothetical protein